jgi:hypothetical protein
MNNVPLYSWILPRAESPREDLLVRLLAALAAA